MLTNREYYLVGLGNPGAEYTFTRHNVGFMVLDLLQRTSNVSFVKSSGVPASVAQCEIKNNAVCLVKPLTFMNRSGLVVEKLDLIYSEDDAVENLLVIYDDVRLPLGTVRYRTKGTDGGHNGLKSVIARLGSDKFHRLRIGVGTDKPIRQLHDFVLGNFKKSETDLLSDVLIESVNSIEWYLEHGIQGAMNKWNGMIL